MDGLRYMKTALAWLSEARHFNRMMAITLRVAAVLIVPFSLVTFFKAGKVIFDLPASGILGGIVFQIFFVAAIIAVVQILFIRAREIDALEATRFYMFPLTSVVVRAVGEALTAFIACIAIGGGVFVWFTAKSIAAILNPPPYFLPVFGDTTFLGGIEFMVGGLLSAIALLGLSYLVVQLLVLVGELASRMEERKEKREPSAANNPSGYRLRSGTDD